MEILVFIVIILIIAAVLSDQSRKNQEQARRDSVENRLMFLEMAGKRYDAVEQRVLVLEMTATKHSRDIAMLTAARKPEAVEAADASEAEKKPAASLSARRLSPLSGVLSQARAENIMPAASAKPAPLSPAEPAREKAPVLSLVAEKAEPAAPQASAAPKTESEPARTITPAGEITVEAKPLALVESNDRIWDEILDHGTTDTEKTSTTKASTAKTYTEKASRMEMEFAGTWLNFTGIIFLIIGIITYLTITLRSAGLLQAIGGIGLGLLLVFIGHYLYQKNMQKFAHPLIGGGFCILFFTVCASYFYYHIIGSYVLFCSIFAIVAWSGISIFKYDSKLIGNGMLIAAFLAPFFMQFSFSGTGIITFYLIAINCGVAYVAYYKKWDYFTTVAFLATYLLYFYNFHMTQPVHALFFLIAIYLLFLLSNNILHFTRKSSSDYHLFLSYLSPTVFAITSYFVLLKMANIWATSVYVLLGVIHLGLTWQARKMEEKDPMFSEIVRNNLVLGILFLTASVSFITYFSKGTTCFSIVTALWFAEALGLLKLSFLAGEYGKILRRYSYFAMLLASAQLLYVIPTMEGNLNLAISRFVIYLLSAGVYLAYFLTLYGRRDSLGEEERAAMTTALTASMAVVTYMVGSFSPAPLLLPVAYGILSFSTLLAAGRILPEYERFMRRASVIYLVMASYQVFAVLPDLAAPATAAINNERWMWLVMACAYFGYFSTLYRGMGNAGKEERAYMTMSLLASLCLGSYLVMTMASGLLYLQVAATLVSALFIYMSFRYYELLKGWQNLGHIGLMLTVLSILGSGLFINRAPFTPFLNLQFGAMLLIAAVLYLTGTVLRKNEDLIVKEEKWTIAAIPYMIGIVLMKSVLAETTGSASTLIWALTALGLLVKGQKDPKGSHYLTLAQFTFLVSFIKSVLFDANFVCVSGGIDIAATGAASLRLFDVAAIIGIIAIYVVAARMVWANFDLRNFLIALALFIFCFQSSFILYKFYGILDYFQVILSGFWSIFAFLFITYGIYQELKISRQFGLMLLVASILKICFVDLWVLNAYNKVTTFIIIGVLLLITSFLYQKHRNILAEKYQAKKLAIEAA
ncbi:MAG: DUF2339 domain-containing protein [Candidatus Eremiobacteraeota bacterium]|nr:DUF2339 domain-containing protein [Candidatus Eremiobacteraeota bacterium]